MPQQKYDVERIKAFVGEDQEMLKKMVHIFLANTPQILNLIKTSLAKKDYATLQFNAHKLKTSVDHFSIKTLTKEIRQIEDFSKTETNLDQLPQLIELLEKELYEVTQQIKADFKII